MNSRNDIILYSTGSVDLLYNEEAVGCRYMSLSRRGWRRWQLSTCIIVVLSDWSRESRSNEKCGSCVLQSGHVTLQNTISDHLRPPQTNSDLRQNPSTSNTHGIALRRAIITTLGELISVWRVQTRQFQISQDKSTLGSSPLDVQYSTTNNQCYTSIYNHHNCTLPIPSLSRYISTIALLY